MGNLRYSWDGRNNVSETLYSSTYDYAYPTSVRSPVPDSTGVYGLNTELTTSTAYDYNTGLPTEATDANGQITELKYEDPLLRPTKVIAPNGHQTITEYGAATSSSTRWVKSKSQIDATNWKEAISWFDGLGRGYLSQSIDDELDDVFAVTCYDNMGRVLKSSNPVRASSAPTCSSSLEWTTPGYDLSGRTISVTTPDSAVVETAYSLATSGSQIGTVVTVEDQAGKLRRSVTNALGKLKRVDEPTTSGLGATASPNQFTAYDYDILNNLITVSQGVQTRSFQYDALSRLKQATNPESGTINYTYDANGNLATKIDARTITTTYTYDRLNRVTLRDYSDGTTPNVSYYYDNLTNGKGKLKKVTSTVSITEYTGYDILGRVTAHKQTTDSVDYTTGYTYDLAGNLLEQTYPSGRVVKNTLDSDGALSQVQSKRSSETYRNFANGFNYNAADAVTSMRLGNGLWETNAFNSRLQPIQIGLGLGSATQNKLKLDYSYGTNTNNGNVLSQTITIPGVTDPFVQTYTYDELNRVLQADEKPLGWANCTSDPTKCWEQTFTYDRYGNRNFDEANTTTLVKNCGSSPNFTVCAADRKIVNPGFEANNRLETDDDYVFDNAGNTTEDALGRTFVYDAENKQIEVKDNSVAVGEYSYDGDGKRIKKHVPGTGELTVFIYDAAGKLIQEHSTIVQTGGNAKTVYTTNDHLGSPRINTDATGQVISRHDYHPFGDEVTRSGYGSDTIRKQFTGYERDGETDLDYAQARMFGSSLGRFTSPDPALVSASLQNPQTWNRFAYVMNNPLKYSDPLGLWAIRQTVYMKKDKNGDNTKEVDYVELVLFAEEGDDVNTLKDQFNLKSVNDATKLLTSLEKNGMRLSKADNSAIRNVFKEIERIEKDYQQDIIDKGGVEEANDNGRDCSMTTARISFQRTDLRGTPEVKAFAEGDRFGVANPERDPEDAKTGDAVLWMKDAAPTHLATFLMFNRSGEPLVYSKTNSTGPYERSTISDLSKNNQNFGRVTNYYVGRP
jgi:RHS repeat-associated protein